MSLRDARKLLREHARFFVNNGLGAAARRRFAPDLIRTARHFGYLHWPREVEARVRGCDVLDVGCGMGLHSIGFLVSGVRSYTGCDPKVQLDSDQIKNPRAREVQSCGWTPRQLMERFREVLYVRGTLADLPRERRWDVAVLHNTTEHLMDFPGVLAELRSHLREGGLLVFRHHNYYSWNGHHQSPKEVAQIDHGDSEQRKVIDWAHVRFRPEAGSYPATKLNRLRLDEVRSLTENHYEVEQWDESASRESEGRLRLTDEIRRALPQFTERDLVTQSVYCVARLRASAVAPATNQNGTFTR